MGGCASVFRRPKQQTQIIEDDNGNSVDNTTASGDSSTRPLTIPVEPVTEHASYGDALIQPSAPQAQVQLDLSIPSNIVDDNLAPGAMIIPQPVTPDTHETQPVAFDVDPFAIPSTSIERQTEHATSSGDLGDIWKCSMIIDPATSTEVAVKSIRITDIRNEEAIEKAKKRLRREVAVWIRLRHAHVLTLHGTVSGFGQLPALVSKWMHNGALDGYLERTSLTMEQKLKLLKQVVDGLKYRMEPPFRIHFLSDNFSSSRTGSNSRDLTSTNVLIDRDGNAFLADFGLSVALAEGDRSYYNSFASGAVRWLAPELIGSLEPESNLDNSHSDLDFQKPNGHSDVFSLGCIMLHVFSGKPPFWWLRNVRQLFSARFKRVEPYQLEPSVTISHQHLDFMRKCWSAKPEVRPSTGDAASFVEDELARVPSPQSD